ncbi:MAG: GNAT family N-acetyltransferase [Mariniblastus sp.]|nr:GNAT family N-acetyltransferase [Mariniblastus sp.]
MNEPNIHLRTMVSADWEEVAQLIHDSTNAWYQGRGFEPIFQNGPGSTRLFCEVYEGLDPGCCVLAVDAAQGRIIGSCFFHPRPTHVALGIMNVHPECFGWGIARKLLLYVIDQAERRDLPIRLVSSAMNLDSYSLYNRAGFVPRAVYQDMLIPVPDEGLDWRPAGWERVRDAVPADVPRMVELEMSVHPVSREQDFRYFLENELDIWRVSVLEDELGQLHGFLVSVDHPGSNMLGPGIARDADVAAALIAAQLDHQRGRSPVFLVPTDQVELVGQLYRAGARNCELHFGQVRGADRPATGIVMPTFMPETG